MIALDALPSFFSFTPSTFAEGFVLLFSVFDAIGTVPVFLTITEPFADQRSKIIRKSVLIATVILVLFALFGLYVLNLLGITINDFKIAGGIVLFLVALDYLRGGSVFKSVEASEIAAFPLAMPLLAGPGAISTVMILANPPFGLFLDLLVIISNALLAWVVLDRGVRIQRVMGTEGTKILTRIMGLLIAAIGVAFVREGIQSIVQAAMAGGA